MRLNIVRLMSVILLSMLSLTVIGCGSGDDDSETVHVKIKNNSGHSAIFTGAEDVMFTETLNNGESYEFSVGSFKRFEVHVSCSDKYLDVSTTGNVATTLSLTLESPCELVKH